MNIKFVLNVFGWRIGSFDVSIDMGESEAIVPVGVAAKPTFIDGISDWFATRYIERRLIKHRNKEVQQVA